MEFEKKGLDSDVVSLRFKHYQSRLIDTLNRILEERKRLSNYITLIKKSIQKWKTKEKS